MITKSVAISGTIGIQVYDTTIPQKVILRGLQTYNQTSACSVTIRSGNASGTIILQHASPAGNSNPLSLPGLGIRFDNGMHVKVLGASNSLCYLFAD